MNASQSTEGRSVVYCLVPPELAERLHEPLREHFAGDPGVEVVVERRAGERRGRRERRRANGPKRNGSDRRRILDASGRRVGERRATVAGVEPFPLPRRARRYAKQLRFVRRVEPVGERAEDLDTARVVARVQAGDREAFGTIYTRYFPRVYGYLRVALKDRHEAEDLTQEVFVSALARITKYKRGGQPFRAWLFTIARNEAINQLRRSGRLDVEDPADLDARRDEAVADGEPKAIAMEWISDPDLLLFVERLPDPQRQVLAMRYLLDLRTNEIARVLERTPNDVSKLQYRALEFLRERLRAIGREPARREKRISSRHRPKQAEVLRARRFALYE